MSRILNRLPLALAFCAITTSACLANTTLDAVQSSKASTGLTTASTRQKVDGPSSSSLRLAAEDSDSSSATEPSASESPAATKEVSQPSVPVSGTTSGGAPDVKALPKKTLSFVIGALVGTPICMVRKTLDEEKAGINGMAGNTKKKPLKYLAAAIWFPFAVVSGCAEAPVYSTINSLGNTDKPFSRDQFSLEEMKAK